jgi:photosystem II stability/assembly factor-like uncharacterized protein
MEKMKNLYAFVYRFSFFLLILNSSNVTSAQTGSNYWQWLNPKPSGTNINDIHILNNSTIIAVGESGFIGRSNNSGSTWTFITRTVGFGIQTPSFNGVHFPGPFTGYVVGANNLILKTTDGGISWNNLTSPVTGDLPIWNSVFFTDELNGWIVGLASGPTPLLYKTNDGGINWIPSSNLPASASGQTLNTIRFTNANFGLITATSGKIYKTTDGGINWDDISISNTGSPNPSTASYRGLGIVNEQIFIAGATNNSILMRTTDGGSTWSRINMGSFGFPLVTAPFLQIDVNGNNVLVASGGGYRLLSTNQGLNWNFSQIYPSTIFNSTQFSAAKISPDGSKYFLMGNFGIYADSVAGGGLWNRPYTNIDFSATNSKLLNSISFVNSNTAIAAGDAGIIYRTTDGGQTWANLSINTWVSPAINITTVKFPAINSAYLGTSNSVIHKSTNGGVNWAPAYTMPNAGSGSYRASDFIDATTGWFTHANGRISKTIDGSNWTDIDPNSVLSTALNSIDFINSNTGWICGAGTQIYKSTDGGNNWTQLTAPPGVTGEFNSIMATDDQNVFAAGTFGKIIKSTNGGTSWADISIPNVFIPLTKILFIDALKGFVFGLSGNAFYTENGGISWVDVSAPSNDALQDACIKGNFGSITPQLNDENIVVVGGRLFGGAQRPSILNFKLNTITPVNNLPYNSHHSFKWQSVSDRLILLNNNLSNGRYIVTIRNAAGSIISSQAINHPGGQLNKVISDILIPGIYFISISGTKEKAITLKAVIH